MSLHHKFAHESGVKGASFTERLNVLRQNCRHLGNDDTEGLLTLLLEELKLSVEMLTAQEEVVKRLQNELAQSRQESERASLRYKDMINYHPAGCLMTDLNGKILDANREAAAYLNLPETMLTDQPIVLFIEESERRNFNQQLQGRFRASRRMRYKTRLQPRQKPPVEATITVSAVENRTGQPSSLLFVLQV